jgi:phosphonate transport system substrate-binding protein
MKPIPYCNFGVSQRIDDAFAKKFKEVVLGITENDTVEINGETVKVLNKALVDGYVDITDKDFDSVREMAKRTNMPPYQKF